MTIPLDERTIRVAKAIHAREHPLQRWDDLGDAEIERYVARAFYEVMTWEEMIRKRMAETRQRILATLEESR